MSKVVYTCRLFALSALLILISQWASAQQTGTIRGTVKDASGDPLSGASVTVEGRRTGTVTDARGSYTLRVSPGTYTLVVSFVGQGAQRVQVNVTTDAVTQQDVSLTEMADLGGILVVGTRSRLQRS